MAGAMAASWISPLKRSLWDDSPSSPVGPWKALASGSLESKFFLGCGFPPPLQHSWQAPGILEPTSPCGARSLDGLGPGPGSGEHTAHHCEHYHQQCTRRTDSFSLGTESLGPGRLQLLDTLEKAGNSWAGTPQWHFQWVGRVFTVTCQALPLRAGRRQLSGSGWSKYPLFKCQMAQPPPKSICSPLAANTLTPSPQLAPWTPG